MEVPESRERHSSLALSYKGAEIERSIPQTKTSDLASKQIRIVGSSRCVRRIAMGLQYTINCSNQHLGGSLIYPPLD